MKVRKLGKVLLVGLALAGVPAALANWFDNFDSYPVGPIHGLGGWLGWDNAPAATGMVSNTHATSAPNSQQILHSSDSVQLFNVTAGKWIMEGDTYFDTGYAGNTFFIILNKFQHQTPHNFADWSAQVYFDGADTQIKNYFDWPATPGYGAFVKGQWSHLSVKIDLPGNLYTVVYNGQVIYSQAWNQNPPQGQRTIQCIDLYGGDPGPPPPSNSLVWYDNVGLHPWCPGDLNCDGLIDFGDIDPFVAALSYSHGIGWPSPCTWLNGDINGDNDVAFDDIDPFVALLSSGATCP